MTATWRRAWSGKQGVDRPVRPPRPGGMARGSLLPAPCFLTRASRRSVCERGRGTHARPYLPIGGPNSQAAGISLRRYPCVAPPPPGCGHLARSYRGPKTGATRVSASTALPFPLANLSCLVSKAGCTAGKTLAGGSSFPGPRQPDIPPLRLVTLVTTMPLFLARTSVNWASYKGRAGEQKTARFRLDSGKTPMGFSPFRNTAGGVQSPARGPTAVRRRMARTRPPGERRRGVFSAKAPTGFSPNQRSEDGTRVSDLRHLTSDLFFFRPLFFFTPCRAWHGPANAAVLLNRGQSRVRPRHAPRGVGTEVRGQRSDLLAFLVAAGVRGRGWGVLFTRTERRAYAAAVTRFAWAAGSSNDLAGRPFPARRLGSYSPSRRRVTHERFGLPGLAVCYRGTRRLRLRTRRNSPVSRPGKAHRLSTDHTARLEGAPLQLRHLGVAPWI